MYKLILPHQFPGESPIREVTADFTKTASYCPPEMKVALADFKPVEGKTCVIVNALGSAEFWGSNVNGDAFPERALLSKEASHGYKTFELYANVYEHHVNKDPAKAMGSVKLAAWNPVMHRVELLLEIDNQKGSGFLQKVAEGEFPDVSMGCKVPYDICSSCGHQAKKVAEYCGHLKTSMNKIGGDGRKICAINTLPKFFDISHVLIGADKTAKTLRKVASGESAYSSAVLGLHVYGEDGEEEEKQASPKIAVIEKEIPVGPAQPDPAVSEVARKLEKYEPELPLPVLKKLSDFPLGETLSTLGYSGVVLKPREFQTIVLIKINKPSLAGELHRKRVVFRCPCDDEMEDIETSRDDKLMNPDNISDDVFKTIRGFVPHRSIAEPQIRLRVIRIRNLPKDKVDNSTSEVKVGLHKNASASLVELLGALGLSYWLYRRGFPQEAKEFERAIAKKPWLAPILLGGAVAATEAGQAVFGPSSRDQAVRHLQSAKAKYGAVSWKTIGTVMGPVGLAYLTSASAQRKRYRGQSLTGFERLMESYPGPVAIVAALGLLKARKAFHVPKLKT